MFCACVHVHYMPPLQCKVAWGKESIQIQSPVVNVKYIKLIMLKTSTGNIIITSNNLETVSMKHAYLYIQHHLSVVLESQMLKLIWIDIFKYPRKKKV